MVWAKFDDGYPDHHKIVPLSDAAFRVHTACICYVNRDTHDGRVPKAVAHRYTTKGKKAALELIRAGLFTEDGDHYEIHDFHDYNPTPEQVRSLREARREAGRKGGQSKRSSKPEAKGEANAQASASANGKQNGTPYPGPVPEGDEETSQTALIHRVANACERADLDEATSVVSQLLEHVDGRLIDECLGWVATRDESKRPRSPRFFLTVVSDWARQRGVVLPELGVSA